MPAKLIVASVCVAVNHEKRPVGGAEPGVSSGCEGRDSNSHRIAPTRSLVWRVYQFRHLRERTG